MKIPERGWDFPRSGGRLRNYHEYMNETRTLLIRVWNDGTMMVSTRASEQDAWDPPETLWPEKP